MKKTITILLLQSIALFSFCQVVITESNYPAPADTVFFADVTSQVTAPAVGNNQLWDYSSINIPAVTASLIYSTVNNDPDFPTAMFVNARNFKGLTPALGYYYNQYYIIDSAGARGMGIHVPAQSYGLGALTGNNADTLYILDNVLYYPNTPMPLVTFPASAGSAWGSNTRHVVNMQLSVAAASLNKAPLQQVFYLNRNDSIAGWGTLKLPAASGYITDIQVLEDQTTQYTTDSFYLNGSPAPGSIIGPFGITQGQITEPIINRRQFYRPGLFNYQMSFNYTDNTFSSLYSTGGSYLNLTLPVATGINTVSDINYLQVYPNPVEGDEFNIAANISTGVKTIVVYDITGKLISRLPVANAEGLIKVQLNPKPGPGIYLFNLVYTGEQIAGHGKIIVAK